MPYIPVIYPLSWCINSSRITRAFERMKTKNPPLKVTVQNSVQRWSFDENIPKALCILLELWTRGVVGLTCMMIMLKGTRWKEKREFSLSTHKIAKCWYQKFRTTEKYCLLNVYDNIWKKHDGRKIEKSDSLPTIGIVFMIMTTSSWKLAMDPKRSILSVQIIESQSLICT